MKLTKRQLVKLIKEELGQMASPVDPSGPPTKNDPRAINVCKSLTYLDDEYGDLMEIRVAFAKWRESKGIQKDPGASC